MQKIIIPAIGPSANRFYAGLHPFVRSKLAKTWHRMVQIEVSRQKLSKYDGRYPVDVKCSVRFQKGARMTDADNCSPTAKLILDGLVLCGVIANDSPRYVRSVTLVPERSPDGTEHTVVTITPAGEDALRADSGGAL